jgi:ribonuclease J
MKRFVQAARETGYLTDFPQVVPEEESVAIPAAHVLYLCTGSQGEPRAALSRIASDDHPFVKLGEGDTVIFSSRIIPGNELPIFELHNKLAALNVTVLTERDHFIHVSGHPAREELAEMYRWVKPQIAIPVHGELRHMHEHARIAQALQVPQSVIALNGQMVRLAPGRAEIIDETPAGRMHLDGRIILPEEAGIAKARRALAFAGFIGVTLLLDRRGRSAGDPVFHFEGVPEQVHDGVIEAVETALGKKQSGDELAESVRRAARRAAQDVWGKKPVVRVEAVEI